MTQGEQHGSVTVSVVIVNFNGRHLLDDCLDSLRSVTVAHEVIVVDNASSDGSVEHLRSRHPTCVVVETGSNLGFGRGCNAGVDVAKGRYVLLLNSDARLTADLAAPLRFLEEHPEIAVVGGRLNYGDGRLQTSMGLEHTPLRTVASWAGLANRSWAPDVFRRELRDAAQYDRTHVDVAWVSGALMLIDRSAWSQVGGFCPEYFMYVEDVDFCRAIRRAGRKVAFLPDWHAVHLEGGGKEWLGRFALLNTMDSYLVYMRRYYPYLGGFVVRLGLIPILAARSVANAFLALMARRRVRRDQAIAYAAACLRLVR